MVKLLSAGCVNTVTACRLLITSSHITQRKLTSMQLETESSLCVALGITNSLGGEGE